MPQTFLPVVASQAKHYARRTAVERVYGFEEHFIRGRAKMTLRVGLAMAHLKEKHTDHIRSLFMAYRPPARPVSGHRPPMANQQRKCLNRQSP